MTIFFAVTTGLLLGAILGAGLVLTCVYMEEILPALEDCKLAVQSYECALESLEKRLEQTEVES